MTAPGMQNGRRGVNAELEMGCVAKNTTYGNQQVKEAKKQPSRPGFRKTLNLLCMRN